MCWHEDFGDEPSVEERMPYGLSPAEVHLIVAEASLHRCEECGKRFLEDEVISTGIYEYYMMDIDPESVVCLECYEACQAGRIPTDPSLIDCYTPLRAA
jgi:hypothetical protein